MKHLILLLLFCATFGAKAQTKDSTVTQRKNSAQTLIDSKGGNLLMAAYGEVHYNQQVDPDTRYNGELDVHRQVLLFGYKFDQKTSFITEIEIEHIKEVFLEQAFLNYQAKPWLNVQAGLLLIPMGIVNEYHEPTTFNGVERPVIDNVLVPTTWREIGAGVAGNIPNAGLRYQLYLVNGPLGYDGSAKLNGSKPIRGARQKGSQVTMTSPDFSGKLTYYGIKGLDFGLAGYFGNTESSLFNNLKKDSLAQLNQADSSSIGIAMIGVDFRYQLKKFETRGELILANLSNTDQYNALTGTDLGTNAFGYYIEAGYDISSLLKMKKKLVPFVRYSNFNSHNAVNENQTSNLSYASSVITSGLTWYLNPNFVAKGDFQQIINGNDKKSTTINLGVGYWFR
ncbi:MAG: hypothetical protein HKP14_10080 [Bacteroidia bacterium]|nr:hypothetical protein [Bacteroidia bacterium]